MGVWVLPCRQRKVMGLIVRDVATDRELKGTRDGDVFIQTWATAAANNKDARKVRRTSEAALSFDDLIASWRDAGFFVGVVIDEAHLNFGASAKVAAGFYLDHIQPDFTILATATPSDEKLDAFEQKAGIEVASRVVVPRAEVVEAGLNKVGLKLGVIRFREGDRDLIDQEQATLQAGWTQHCRVRERLKEHGLAVSPLMLVQVEDQAKGAEDPVKRVRDKLLEIGVDDASNHLLLGHSFNRPLASRGAGTLNLTDTDDALTFSAEISSELSEVFDVRDALAGLAVGLIVGISPGFRIPPAQTVPDAERIEEEDPAKGRALVRIIRAAILAELSLVTRPAYSETQIEARNWTPGGLSLRPASQHLRRWRH